MAGTWVRRNDDGSYHPHLAITEVPTAWNGNFGRTTIYPDEEKNGTPWIDEVGKIRLLSRLDGDKHFHELEDRELRGDELIRRGTISMPSNLVEKFWKSGTTVGPEIDSSGKGNMKIHNVEVVDGLYVYDIRDTEILTNGLLVIKKASLEPSITARQFLDDQGKPIYPQLHPESRGNVVYLCGVFDAQIGDRKIRMAAVNLNDSGTVLKPLEEVRPAA